MGTGTCSKGKQTCSKGKETCLKGKEDLLERQRNRTWFQRRQRVARLPSGDTLEAGDAGAHCNCWATLKVTSIRYSTNPAAQIITLTTNNNSKNNDNNNNTDT